MKQDAKLISVIVTAYNIEKYLPRCVDSLLAQTYEPMEIILVDDGSTDGTGGICDEYAQKSKFIHVIHKENGGPSSARNAGLKIAKGDYIGYVDGDDWTEPSMYKDMLEACLDTGAEIAICSYRQVGEGAEEVHPTGKVLALSRQEALELYINGDPQYHIYHSVWSKLFDRKVIKDIRFPEGRKSEDIMYTTWALTKASKCVFLDTLYYNYMVDRSGSIMNSRLHERRFQDEIPFWKEQREYLIGLGMQKLAEKAMYQFYRKMVFYYVDFLDRGMKKSGRQLIALLQEEKQEIKKIYRKSYVALGDKVRMKLILAWPGAYYKVVKAYDRFVIPLRQHKDSQ
ncbi:glycosyltransferase family 2 protein [Parablautia muri]|uniref:Glycosyltransferase n=1 Tax=Parablautia muri TaxID=2320879 RepID=A0A9X5BCL9_9FIRM|nr:glycosyltransferase [Parablautia muri]NBJ91296.1 glycosyltransferase [Parablautia muri]